MKDISSQTCIPSLRPGWIDWFSALDKWAGGVLRRLCHAQNRAAARYEGRTWCDSTEHDLTETILTGVSMCL